MIEIERDAKKLRVKTPFFEPFNKRAKQLGGKWDPDYRELAFPLEAEESVRKTAYELFGVYDGTEPKCNIIIDVDDTNAVKPMYNGRQHVQYVEGLGRVIASARGRDTGANVAEGVVVHTGGYRSGGSMKNFEVLSEKGTQVEMLGVPLPRAEELVATSMGIRISERQTSRKEQLLEEKKALEKRLSEIREELEQR